MIKNTVLNENQIKPDGCIECILSIIKFYNIKSIPVKVQDVVKLYNPKNLYVSIELILIKFKIKSIFCENINISELKKYNEPILLKINDSKEEYHFVLLVKFEDTLGFLIEDPLNGNYYASEKGLESMWKEKNCIVFIS